MNLPELMVGIENPWKKNREYAAFGDNILMIDRRGFFLILKALGKKKKKESWPLAHTIPKS